MRSGSIVKLVTGFWTRISFNRSPPSETCSDGTITPGKISAAFITFFGVAIAVYGAALILYGTLLATALICLVVGGALTIFMAPSLTRMHDVNWNSTEVNGPSKLFGLSLGRSRTAIRWDEVTSTGKTATSYWFIQSDDGRRIYWSYLYSGYGQFVDNLISNRPQIELPEDLR